MDLYPTLAALGGASVPGDRIVDGRDIAPLMLAEEGAESPHDAFFYYRADELRAVRSGRWKLHVRLPDHVERAGETCELYDLRSDIAETNDVHADHPDIVKALMAKLDSCRRDLGDSATGAAGEDVRPVGRVEQPRHLDPLRP